MRRAQRFRLNEAETRLAKHVLLGVLALGALVGMLWGVNAYLWSMPVDSYTIVLTGLKGSGIPERTYTSHDAGFANGMRQSINNDPSYDVKPACSGGVLGNIPPAGTAFAMTFRRDGVVIETVTGAADDCELAQVHCGLINVWKIGVEPIPFAS